MDDSCPPVEPTSSVHPFLTVPEAAEMLRVSQATMWRLLADGSLARHKVRRRTFVSRREVVAMITRCGDGGSGEVAAEP